MSSEIPSVPGVKVDMKADFTGPLNTVATELPKGIRKLTHLVFGKHDADVARYKALIAAQTQRDCELVLSGNAEYRDGELVPVEPSPTPSIESFSQVEAQQELKNIAGNVLVALERLSQTPDNEISDEDVDPDFFARWRREAKVIGNKELQQVWGRLLAEEIKAPKSISYRTIDTIKNITSTEAKLFYNASAVIVNKLIFVCDPSRDKFPEKFTLNMLLSLDDCGLVCTPTQGILMSTTHSIEIDGAKRHVLVMPEVILVDYSNSKEFRGIGVPLTSVGRQVLLIADKNPPSQEQVEDVCNLILNTKGCGCSHIKAYKMSRNKIPPQEALLFEAKK